MLSSLIEEYLRSADVELHYQQIAPLQSDTPPHYEALLRAKGKNTAEFVASLEEHRYVNLLDRFVASRVVQTLADHPGIPLIFANISALSIAENGRFGAFISKELGLAGVNPKRLGLEITERMVFQYGDLARSFIATIKAMGCPISFDDFGNGALSLTDLPELRPDYIKIDGSFIRTINELPSRTITQALIHIAHSIEAKAVAECVETPEQMILLRGMGCDYGQGWAIAKPARLEDAIGQSYRIPRSGS